MVCEATDPDESHYREAMKIKTESKSTWVIWFNYHSEIVEEERKVKEPEKELRRRRTRESGVREVWKRKLFEKEEVTKCIKCH